MTHSESCSSDRLYVGTVTAKKRYLLRVEVEPASQLVVLHLKRPGKPDKTMKLSTSNIPSFLHNAWAVMDVHALRCALSEKPRKSYTAGEGSSEIRLYRAKRDQEYYVDFSLWRRRSRMRLDRFNTLVNILRRTAEAVGVNIAPQLAEHLSAEARMLEASEGIDRRLWAEIDMTL